MMAPSAVGQASGDAWPGVCLVREEEKDWRVASSRELVLPIILAAYLDETSEAAWASGVVKLVG